MISGAARIACGSALAQVYNQWGDAVPDVDAPDDLKAFFTVIQELNAAGRLLAYHDRSDGGLLATLAEMMFAGGCGATILLDDLDDGPFGRVVRRRTGRGAPGAGERSSPRAGAVGRRRLWANAAMPSAPPNGEDRLIIRYAGEIVFAASRAELRRLWSETSYRMQSAARPS